ncbi:MAG: hypothetical protein EXS11_02960 [Gemmataceae bacterium]|nr:hypothetical protein [Gemmataceae bacterium]
MSSILFYLFGSSPEERAKEQRAKERYAARRAVRELRAERWAEKQVAERRAKGGVGEAERKVRMAKEKYPTIYDKWNHWG